MANQITLTKKQAVRALFFIGELENLINEQLWDNHHPFGAQEKRELNRLKNSISKKVKRLTKRAPDGGKSATNNPFAQHIAVFKSRRR